jgi:pyruvate formate lyase activating enzyme
MKIGGLQKISMVDYPGKMAAVVFCPGCNLNCYYCHNRGLLGGADGHEDHDPDAVLAMLARRRGFLEGVVVSGGEATLQPDLERFLLDVRDLGYPVKLDTNGTRPDVLEALVRSGLVDYVAMDLKAPAEKYGQVCGCDVDLDAVDRSIRILLGGRVDYEFRTTMAPELTREDLFAIVRWIRGARSYVLQQYRPVSAEWFGEEECLTPPPREAEEILAWAKDLNGFVGHLDTRGLTVRTIGDHARAASAAAAEPAPRRRASRTDEALPAATA